MIRTIELLNFCNNKKNHPVEILERELMRKWKGSDESTTKFYYNYVEKIDFEPTEKGYDSDSVMKNLKKSYNAYICYVLGTFKERGIDQVMRSVNKDKVKSYMLEDLMQCILWTGSVKSCDVLKNFDDFYDTMVDEDIVDEQFITQISYVFESTKLLMSLARFCFNDEKFNKIYANWSKHPVWKRHEELDFYMDCCDVNRLNNSLISTGVIYKEMEGGIRSKWNKERIEVRPAKDVFMEGEVIKEPEEILYYYGEAVHDWIKNLPDRKEFGITKLPSKQKNGKAYDIDSGCVVEGTMIKMFDQEDKAIEKILPEDLILNKTMCASICSEELVLNDNVDKIYGINEDEAFMSLEHAVFTQEKGWCSLEPECANEINPRWKVKKLCIGDHVLKINNQNELYYELVKNIHIAENNKRCYDLHFYEGSNSYFANGYANLLNYPVLTLTSVMNALQSQNQLENLKKNWNIIAPMLETILSKSTLDYIKKSDRKDR